MKVLFPVLSLASLVAIAAMPPKVDPQYADRYWKAIRSNDLVALKGLIRKAGVKVKDARGNTPLFIAAADGSTESVRILLRAGADPNATNQLSGTPLLWCANDASKVKLLFAAGAKVDAKSKLGHTALEIAVGEDAGVEAAKMLMRKGADVNAVDRGGTSVLESAASGNNLKAAKLLIAAGAKVNYMDHSHQSAILAAAANGYLSEPMVKLLLAHGAKTDVVALNNSGGTVLNGPIAIGGFNALHLSANMSEGSTRALLATGLDVNAKDVRGDTPLVFAVATDHPMLDSIKLLLDHGAQRDAALIWARRYNNPEVLALFGEKAVDPQAGLPLTEQVETDETVRASIARSLACSQPAALKFRKSGGCISCHSQVATGLAVSGAQGSGIAADFKLESKQAHSTAFECGNVQELAIEMQDPGGGAHTMANFLSHIASGKIAPSMDTDAMVHFILGFQRKEGDWPSGSFERPPMEDGSFTMTAQAIRALRQFPIPALKTQIDARVDCACAYLERTHPTTTEDRCMQVMGLIWAGKAPSASMLEGLTRLQRPDGGWGQTPNLPTDGYATGEVLLALRATGSSSNAPVYQRGVKFLLSSQDRSGAWHVATRSLAFQPYFQSGFPFDHDQWISQQGTAYAALALEQALTAR